ncbi:MAG TPA: redoxin domain-containing protein [Deltaproteobacteria bacterium]|nr:redoxin domain-containing protein [Deltaproteobacteria bacterium]HPP80621.1 redoxin domain-containing protein [Deltaproteobacteria bacterium]
MRHTMRVYVCIAAAAMFLAARPGDASAVQEGGKAPLFSLKGLDGKVYSLASMEKSPMLVLYFFDASSRPSQEGLLSLDGIAKRYRKADLTVWGVTASAMPKAQDFVNRTRPGFPVLLDTAGVGDAYGARQILPSVYILGPGLKVLDVIQGGGKSMAVMLTRLAERKLQQKDTDLAMALGDAAAKTGPGGEKALAVKGYAALKAGRVDQAEKTFAELARGKGKAEVLGKEGLAAVYAHRGETDKAFELASQVERMAPERGYAHVVKADVLYARNKKSEAMKEYEAATKKPDTDMFQKALAYNKLGRLHASVKDYKTSRELYEKAVTLDPYYVEAMANKGLAYEKEGRWDKALDAYREGQATGVRDDWTRILAARAMEMMEYQKDEKRRERVDRLVKELSQRFREQKRAPAREDTWTSPPMVLGFVDFQEQGMLSERDGMSIVLTAQLAENLKASGRVKVVDRVLLDRLLEELNLGSSELADGDTALRLGRVLAARVLATGSIVNLGGGAVVTMRLLDTETTSVAKVITLRLPTGAPDQQDVFKLNRQILETLVREYPLRAYVVEVKGDEVMINLGSDQGVVQGTRFEVLEEGPQIEFKGRKLKGTPKVVGVLEVVRVEPGLSWCRVISSDRPLAREDKIVEKAPQALGKG